MSPVIGFSVRVQEMYTMLSSNRLFISRLNDVGILSSELINSLALSGPVARAGGKLIDARLLGYC